MGLPNFEEMIKTIQQLISSKKFETEREFKEYKNGELVDFDEYTDEDINIVKMKMAAFMQTGLKDEPFNIFKKHDTVKDLYSRKGEK